MAAVAPDAPVMSGVVTRAQAVALARADALRSVVRDRLATLLPGAVVEKDADGVTVTGRGIVRRWLGTAALRDPGGWLP